MKRITKSEHAYFVANSIIAYKPNSYYFGNFFERQKLFNDVTFAKVNNTVWKWDNGDIGLSLDIFTKKDSNYGVKALTESVLKEYENGYMDARYATVDEIKLLKDLVVSDKAVLGNYYKEKAIEFLTNYIEYLGDDGIPPCPFVFFSVLRGHTTFWEKVDPYKNFERPEEFKIIGDSSDYAVSEL